MNYSEIAQAVIEQATDNGFEAEAYINVGFQTQIQVDRGEVEKLSYAGSKGAGIRVLRDGQARDRREEHDAQSVWEDLAPLLAMCATERAAAGRAQGFLRHRVGLYYVHDGNGAG